MKKILYKKRGMTLTEIIVVLGILGIIMLAVTNFQVDILNNNRYANDSLTVTQDARIILRTMVKEMRTASPSNNGSYAIVTAGTSSLTFFSDINSDGVKDQIRYFISGRELRKGRIIPTGSPLVYNPLQENITTLAYNVKNTSNSPLFEYFDSTYTGTTSPMTQPVVTTNIRLIKINLMLDVNPNKSPVPRTYASQVTLRNIKDNL